VVFVRRRGNPGRPTQVQIVAPHRLEEMPPLHRAGKHLGQAHLDLLQGESVRVAGGPVRCGHRHRQSPGPPIEEGLHVGGPELIADRLQAVRGSAREKAIVEALNTVRAPELWLHTLVPIQTELDGIRQVGPDLEERRTPLGILHVEVIVIHGRRLAGESRSRPPCQVRTAAVP
jgi:hypothetical protein